MPTFLIRWALPHRGPCTHLSAFEYRLRVLVFGAIWIVAFLPAAITLVFVGFGLLPALAIFIGFSGMMDGRFNGFSDDQIAIFALIVASWLLSFLICRFLKYRYLTTHW
ncbi:hypothetical protein [Aureimonas pseudogalii]|uniref:Uncharacterized protein n=1 Tax=Aureimonas pseudogalii TaxID=1744844 RepID=A0A7W6H7N7_9HYPH|nr:hypothetical protein [Aureimonas pseudogalii]MBB4000113.1 hypothetical protein [Aureimonas pseudogalii]